MSIYRKSHEEIQVSAGLPLFDWRPAVRNPATGAGRFLRRRYLINPAIADLVAELAGLGQEVAR